MIDITQPEWLELAPKLPKGLPDRWQPLWHAAWSLCPRSVQPPVGMLDDTWLTVGAGYFMPAFGHWDIVHVVLDMLAYDVDLAARQLRLVVKTLRDTDGRLPGVIRQFQDEAGVRYLIPEFDFSAPPLWPTAATAVFERTGDVDFLRLMYNAAVKGVRWFEENRRLPVGLFWFRDSVGSWGWEAGLDTSPRWDDREKRTRPLAIMDLSAWMGMYYDALGSMAESLGLKHAGHEWRERSQQIAELVCKLLWHEEDGMFYDRDIETGKWNRVKTVCCFWPMIAGQASAEQAKRLAEHLADPQEYFTKIPVPTVALNDPKFELDIVRGPTLLSQTYWVMRGLHRYGFSDLARQIGTRALDGAAEAFAEHGTIFEFYHPQGGPVSELKRKGDPGGPKRDYIGHSPIHAIAMNTIGSWS